MAYDRENLKRLLSNWAQNIDLPGEPVSLSKDKLEAIYLALPPDHGFRSVRELERFFSGWHFLDTYFDRNDEEAEVNIDVDAILPSLEHGQEYRYECILGETGGALSSAEMWHDPIRLDDSTALTLGLGETVLRVVGKTTAPWHRGALNITKGYVSTLIGASLALDLAVRKQANERGYDLSGFLSVTEASRNEQHKSTELNDAIICTYFTGRTPSAMDQKRAEKEGVEELRNGWFRPIVKLWSDNTPRGVELKRACEVLCQAHASWEPAEVVWLCVMCLEGLLLPSDEESASTSRIKEAVAFLLGKTHENRRYYRNIIDKLYEVRSKYVHQGVWSGHEFRNAYQRQKILNAEEDIESKALEVAKSALKLEILNAYAFNPHTDD